MLYLYSVISKYSKRELNAMQGHGEAYLVLPEVDGELVDSVLAEVTREHVARTRAVTERVRHGSAGCLSWKHSKISSASTSSSSCPTSTHVGKIVCEQRRRRTGAIAEQGNRVTHSNKTSGAGTCRCCLGYAKSRAVHPCNPKMTDDHRLRSEGAAPTQRVPPNSVCCSTNPILCSVLPWMDSIDTNSPLLSMGHSSPWGGSAATVARSRRRVATHSSSRKRLLAAVGTSKSHPRGSRANTYRGIKEHPRHRKARIHRTEHRILHRTC